MRSLLFVIISLAILSSCNNDRHAEKNGIPSDQLTYVDGDLLGGEGRIIYLEKLEKNGYIGFDSLTLGTEGKFETFFRVDQPGFYSIRNDKGNIITFIASGNDTVHISSDYDDFSQYELSGSKELEEIEKLNRATQKFLTEMEKLAAINRDSAESENYRQIKLDINNKYQKAYHELREFSREFLERNRQSLVSLLALTNQLGPDLYVFHPVKDMGVYLKTDSMLYANYPETDAVKALHENMITIKNSYGTSGKNAEVLNVGDKAPEIALSSPEGKKVHLSSTRGKYVLLDFWASWCPPCRRENPALVETYEKYHEKGFEIFQVSLDRSREKWLEAIENDHLNWIHVSDLKYWDSEVVDLYHINSIPDNFLLDPEGRIIAKDLRGEELELKLKEIFND